MTQPAQPPTTPVADTPADPAAAWAELLAGNARFRAGEPRNLRADARAHDPTQHPFALVVGCLDSRVPAELIFDQGFGRLCVVRTGGHVVDQAVAGSVEFAVAVLDVSLVVVLGHQYCGAVAAALRPERPEGPLGYLVERIAPAARNAGADPETVLRRHVGATAAELRVLPAVAAALADGRLAVVGARYDVDSGAVERVD